VAENYLPAKTLMGLLLFEGEEIEKDVVKGMSMVIEAANQGYEPAKVNALTLTGELAKLGEPVAMFNAGFMCLKGWGGEWDPNTCVSLIEKAGESGHEKSVKFLASLYEKGKYGIAPDKEKAAYWSGKVQK
jgi:TPR repeat protein